MKRLSPILVAAVLLAAVPAGAQGVRATARQADRNRLTDVRTGTVVTREGLRLRVVTDIGNVRILTQGNPSNQVSYTVRIETDGRQPEARALLQQFRVTSGPLPNGVLVRGVAPWKKEYRGRIWVTFEVRVPQRYDVAVETGVGNVETQDIDGQANLESQGGNITAGNIRGSARINTAGGHVTLKDVSGDLTAVTGGGHIEVGNVTGAALLQTAGGHVKAKSVMKWAELRSGGGNLNLEQTGGKVVADSGGGQITLGQVAGAVQARTGGGGIEIRRVTGPMNLETTGGSIYLAHVQGPVQANTGSGQITAYFSATGTKELLGVSQLVCGQGDIVVYLPREIALSIEATIEAAGEHRIVHDPALPVKTNYVRVPGGPRILRGEVVLNGGGQVLKLHTVAGNIKLVYVDAVVQEKKPTPAVETEAEPQSTLERLRSRVKWLQSGALPVNDQVQNRKLIYKVQPKYPERAVKEGIEGWVWLYVVIGEKGAVEDLSVISGHPWLADAAVDAVKNWRYHPTLLDSRPVKVSTVVKVAFSLK